MGSVSTVSTCRHCGMPCREEYWYRTGSRILDCDVCGWYYSYMTYYDNLKNEDELIDRGGLGFIVAELFDTDDDRTIKACVSIRDDEEYMKSIWDRMLYLDAYVYLDAENKRLVYKFLRSVNALTEAIRTCDVIIDNEGKLSAMTHYLYDAPKDAQKIIDIVPAIQNEQDAFFAEHAAVIKRNRAWRHRHPEEYNAWRIQQLKDQEERRLRELTQEFTEDVPPKTEEQCEALEKEIEEYAKRRKENPPKEESLFDLLTKPQQRQF